MKPAPCVNVFYQDVSYTKLNVVELQYCIQQNNLLFPEKIEQCIVSQHKYIKTPMWDYFTQHFITLIIDIEK